MLLNEIISTDKIVKAKGTPKLPGEPIGSGYFAKVYPGRKTNTVIKVADVKNSDDAYINFIREAMDHQDNPFFPRVYNAKLYQTEQSYQSLTPYKYTFVVEMEKLIKLTDDQIYDAIPHILDQLGIEAEELISDTGLSDQDRMYSNDADERHFILSKKLLKAFNDPKELKNISDNEQFKQAVEAVQRLHNKGHDIDMHAANAMVRLTSTGPQLVLTDPVAF